MNIFRRVREFPYARFFGNAAAMIKKASARAWNGIKTFGVCCKKLLAKAWVLLKKGGGFCKGAFSRVSPLFRRIGAFCRKLFAPLVPCFRKAGNFCGRIFFPFFPGKKDNLRQVVVKLVFLVSLITLFVSASYLSGYFFSGSKQERILSDHREQWHDESVSVGDRFAALERENKDFRGWLTVPGTQIDNPVYQAEDDEFYLNHDSSRAKSRYGALFFSEEDGMLGDDMNRVIYGHNMKDGKMFGTLKRYRQLSFFRDHPTFTYSDRDGDETYAVFAVFLLNAVPADESDYVFDISRDDFSGPVDFSLWMDEIRSRSLLQTGVQIAFGDRLMTLVTCASDFDDARLVVMAKLLDNDEFYSASAPASVQASPRYPKAWYQKKGLPYPYDTKSK